MNNQHSDNHTDGWLEQSTDHFAIYFHPRSYSTRVIQRIAKRAEAAYQSGLEWFRLEERAPLIKIYLSGWIEETDIKGWIRLDRSLVSAKSPVIWQIVSPAYPGLSLEWAILEVLARYVRSSESHFASGFLSSLGLLVACENGSGLSIKELNHKVYQRHKQKKLSPHPFEAAENLVHHVADLDDVSLLLFLRQSYGDEALANFVRCFISHGPERAAEEAYGKPLEALAAEWKAALNRYRKSYTSPWHMLRRSYPLLRPYIGRTVELLAYMGVDLLFSLAVSLSIKYLYDYVIGQRSFYLLSIWIGCVLAIFIVGSYASFRRLIVGSLIGELILRDLRRKVFNHLQRLPISFYTRNTTGDTLSRVTNDTDKVQTVLGQHLPDLVFHIISFLGLSILLLYLNWMLGLFVLLLGVPTFAFVYLRYTRRLRDAERQQLDCTGEVTSFLQENLSAQMLVKSFGLEGRTNSSFTAQTNKLFDSSMIVNRLSAFAVGSSDLLNLGLRITILAVGAWMVMRNRMSTGDLIAFITMITQVLNQITAIANKYQRVQTATGAFDRIQELLDEPPEEFEDMKFEELPNLREKIHLEDITFHYDRHETPVLRDISLNINAGEHVAIVGPSGSGKSTLIGLLLRLYDPSDGRIMYDELDLKDVKIGSLRRQIAIVPQDTYLFNMSIMDNILIGREGATAEDGIRAAREAIANEFIEATPAGYDTIVGERGARLSGGQRQRLAIARALIRDPRVIILDEATSALDPATEADILQTFERIGRGRTTVTITHRFTSVSRCDKIFVLDQGQLVESGTHDELMGSGGLYQRLYEEQAGITDGGRRQLGASWARLRAVPLFAKLDNQSLTALAECLMLEQYSLGEEIARQGQTKDKLYLILQGRVEALRHHKSIERRVNILSTGDYFGEASLVNGKAMTATFRALSPTQLYSISRKTLLSRISQDPGLEEALMKVRTERRAIFESMALRESNGGMHAQHSGEQRATH